ncbi:MAG TPA: hypothetical protein VM529_16060 [Gemmata sp.]|nr:hypothetical protein [Gemmata sp.]
MRPDEAEGQPQADRDGYLDELLAMSCLEGKYRPISLSEEAWEGTCRHLAFLKSDLEERRWHDPGGDDEDRPRMILLARWHTLGLLVASGVAYLTSWWVFAASTLVSFLLYQTAMRKLDAAADEERQRRQKQRWEFHPFADREEWLAHKHLLDAYHLPAYDPVTFREPPDARKCPSYLAVPAQVAFYVFVAAMLASMYIWSVFIWPLSLVMMSLCRR